MKHVVVVGAGALGSHLLMFGRNLSARWTLIDFDRVEQKNTLSQAHTKMGVGRNKAQALQQTMQGLWGMRVEAVPHKLTADNVAALLGAADVVVDCTDNATARQLIQGFCTERSVACLHGALAADGGYGRVLWRDTFSIDAGGEGEATCEDGAHLPFIAGVAAQMAGVLQKFLANGAQIGLHVHPGGVVEVSAEVE